MAEDALRSQPRSPLPADQPNDGGGAATEGPIRVVIVHDQRLVREAFRAILSSEDGIGIVGEAARDPQSIDVVQALKPNVVLLDIGTPEMAGIGLIRAIKQECPEAKLLILTVGSDEAVIVTALRAGATGYVSNNASVADLRKAIRGIHQGDVWIERKLIARFLGRDAFVEVGAEDADGPAKGLLTPREQEVLRLLASGGTNKDIAHSLLISEKTVKTHLSSIFRKLNVSRRLQAVTYAIQHGLR